MKRCIILVILCYLFSFMASGRSSLFNQEKRERAKLDPIDGSWIEVSEEYAGIQLVVPFKHPENLQSGRFIHAPYEWKLSDGTIAIGPTISRKYRYIRYKFELNPGDQEGTIDLIDIDDLDKDKEKNDKKTDKPNQKKLQGIYFVKDNYLMICYSQDSRPKKFASSKENPTWMVILKRHDPKSAEKDSRHPKREDK